jgi:gliding motility-associated-like protein
MRCNSGRQFNDPARIAVYDKSTGAQTLVIEAALSSTELLNRNQNDECISNPPVVCYEVGYYQFLVIVPASVGGYVVAAQVNFRIDGINNLVAGYSGIGATYSAEIPGTANGTNMMVNSSAKFIGSDMVVVCDNNSFTYSFRAIDNDGDELRYSFCDAFRSYGGGGGGPNSSVPPPPPPYSSVPYAMPEFGGTGPLGKNVKIDSRSGLISGIAPRSGIYVVTVCAEEIRNGVVIATQRKDLQINITGCSIVAANLPPEFQLCQESFEFTFTNNLYNPLIKSFLWELYSPDGSSITTSSKENFTYKFPDTGIYSIKLTVNKGETCSDSGRTLVRVYPGLKSDFSSAGICFSKPTLFTDKSTTVYGTIDDLFWDFGEQMVISDTAHGSISDYTYPVPGPKNVTLVTTTSKGCTDTATKTLAIVDKPPLQFAFRDTLICVKDSVRLIANASGIVTWSPAQTILGPNPGNPLVVPLTTTTYYADLNDNGCINRDSLTVRVTDRVNLTAMNDSVICAGDTITLRIQSDGLQFSWTPPAQLSNAFIPQPTAITPSTTQYIVTAKIGGCVATENIRISTVSYPIANAGADTMICYQTGAVLNGSTNGISVLWTPPESLTDPDSRNTPANPVVTTTYTLLAYDNKGCPKPGTDQVVVTVLPPIRAFAGNDTAVIVDQPLQLQATGGTRYEWTPATGLSNTSVSNPIGLYSVPTNGIMYQVKIYNEAGCMETDFLNVKVFQKGPAIYVPNAFTPNGDGLNDEIKPVNVSIRQMRYFRVYNRWGKLVFSTSEPGRGWDGKINGQLQTSETYAWVFNGVDYLGNEIVQKGTVTLIR